VCTDKIIISTMCNIQSSYNNYHFDSLEDTYTMVINILLSDEFIPLDHSFGTIYPIKLQTIFSSIIFGYSIDCYFNSWLVMLIISLIIYLIIYFGPACDVTINQSINQSISQSIRQSYSNKKVRLRYVEHGQ